MASKKRYEDEDGRPFWIVRWREGARGRGGRSREAHCRKAGLALAKLREVQAIEDRRGTGLPGGDGSWSVERFFTEKLLPMRGGNIDLADGTLGGWKRRWAPLTEPPRVWHVKRQWGRWALEDINREAVLDWQARMARDPDITKAKMARAHDLLVRILSFAVELGYITAHPALGCRPKYKPKAKPAPWMPDTIERIRQVFIDKAASGYHWSWYRDRDAVLVAVLAYAGLRPGEALALSWSHVGTKHLWIENTIPGLDEERREDGTKTGVDRDVALEAFLRRLLAEWKLRCGPHDDTTPVFPLHPTGAQPWSYSQWVNWRKAHWVPALEAAGVAYVRPYHLRVSCVSMWIYATGNVLEVAARAGHTPEVCLKSYARRFKEYDATQPFVIEPAFADARRAASGQRPSGALSIVRDASGPA